MKVEAYMNHGRWLVNCPRCRVPLPAERGWTVCPVCWPGVMAHVLEQRPDGGFVRVADTAAQAEELRRAEAAGELYEPVYPEGKAALEAALRVRKRENMNWEPGETVAQVTAENQAHGLESE